MSSPVVPPGKLSYRTLWVLLGYAGAAVIVYLSLTPAPHHVASFTFGDKVEHLLAFAISTWWYGQLYPSATGRRRVAVVAAGAAVALERGQQLIGGYAHFEYGDVLASVLGVLLGWALLLRPRIGDALARFDGWLSRVDTNRFIAPRSNLPAMDAIQNTIVRQARIAASAAWRLRWVILANVYLIAPLLIYDVAMAWWQKGKVDKLVLLAVPTSILCLSAVQVGARRLWVAHAALLPFYLLVGADLFLIARYDCRLNSSSISMMIENTGDAWAYVRSVPLAISTSLAMVVGFYLLCLRGLRRTTTHGSRRYFRASVLGVVVVYGGLLLARTPVYHSLEGGLVDTAIHDRSSPFGVLSQGYVALSVAADAREHVKHSASFRFGATRAEPPAEPELYVLVIGESARPDHWGIYGYHRDTTPRLRRQANLLVFRDVVAQVALTQMAVPFLITRQSVDSPDRHVDEKSIVSLYREAGFTTYWLSTQPRGDPWVGAINRYTGEADHSRFFERRYDGILVDGLVELLEKDTSQKIFVVLHTSGSHFVVGDRYPKEFERFPSSGAGLSDKDRMINTYDNSILYTDHVLGELIDFLATRKGPTALVYASDHGENLRDDERNLFGHFLNNEYDLPIPMLIWHSTSYERQWPAKIAAARRNVEKRLSSRVMFGTLADLASVDVAGEGQVSPSVLRSDLVEERRLVVHRWETVDWRLVVNRWETVDFDRDVRRVGRPR